jgi:hypothetical protein
MFRQGRKRKKDKSFSRNQKKLIKGKRSISSLDQTTTSKSNENIKIQKSIKARGNKINRGNKK